MILLILMLSACAVGHLPAEQPMALISQTANKPGGSYDSPAQRTIAATLLGLDQIQRQRFDSVLDTLKRHQSQLRPLVRQFQGQARHAFGSKSFRAAGMQAHWQQVAGAKETHNSGEAAVQLHSLWQSLKPGQRQRAEQQFNDLKAKVSSTTSKNLASIRQRQTQRLRAILPKLQLSQAEREALLAMVLDPNEVLARQAGIRQDIEALIRQLKAPGSNIRGLRQVLTPLYQNQRHWQAQLQKLQSLHGRLNSQQRQQLLALLVSP